MVIFLMGDLGGTMVQMGAHGGPKGAHGILYPWVLMDSMGTHGHPWVPMGADGYLPMGIQWVLMGKVPMGPIGIDLGALGPNGEGCAPIGAHGYS